MIDSCGTVHRMLLLILLISHSVSTCNCQTIDALMTIIHTISKP